MRILKKFMIVPMLIMAGLMIFKMPVVQAAENQAGGLDYSELQYQIGVANGLDSYEYTIETWEVLQSAVETGNKRLSGDTRQGDLDGAAEDIELAIENLIKMDYSSLISSLDVIYEKIDENPQSHDVWYRLDKAVDKARPLLVSGDQAAVDEMTQTLNTLLEELAECEGAAADPNVIIQEVEVEVPPQRDYCNIPGHRIWLTLLVVSVVLNVLLIAALVYVLVKKRSTIEHTPLIHYDLDDDIYGDMIDDEIYNNSIDNDTNQENYDNIEM